MTHLKTFLIAVPVALGLLAAPAAHAEWRGGGGWDHRGGGGWDHRGGGGWDHRGGDWGHHEGYRGRGFPLAGALLGLGAAAVVGGIIASQPPVYAQQPAYYPPQAYPPGYYPPQPYYPAPAYYDAPDYAR
jgi:hypothetical protein